MTTKATIDGYFDSLKQKNGWDSFLADDLVFTSFTSPARQVHPEAAFLEATEATTVGSWRSRCGTCSWMGRRHAL